MSAPPVKPGKKLAGESKMSRIRLTLTSTDMKAVEQGASARGGGHRSSPAQRRQTPN